MARRYRRGIGSRPSGRSRSGIPVRLIIGALIAAVAVGAYYFRSSVNPVTGRTERVSLTPSEEIALGLRAAPEMMREFGGLHPDALAQARVDEIGARLVDALPTIFPDGDNPYSFAFHLLADPDVVNAFALPGGQVFITEALYARLETDGQLAGVLGHEIGHVIERHGAERLAEQGLLQGLVGAVGVAAYDPSNPSTAEVARLAQVVGSLVAMKYGREDELESDQYGVRLTAAAGYDPNAMVRVMEILRDASGGGRRPEFFSTHPDPGNRIGRILDEIAAVFPSGVPDGLIP